MHASGNCFSSGRPHAHALLPNVGSRRHEDHEEEGHDEKHEDQILPRIEPNKAQSKMIFFLRVLSGSAFVPLCSSVSDHEDTKSTKRNTKAFGLLALGF